MRSQSLILSCVVALGVSLSPAVSRAQGVVRTSCGFGYTCYRTYDRHDMYDRIERDRQRAFERGERARDRAEARREDQARTQARVRESTLRRMDFLRYSRQDQEYRREAQRDRMRDQAALNREIRARVRERVRNRW